MIPSQSPVVIKDFTEFYYQNLEKSKKTPQLPIYTNLVQDVNAMWFDGKTPPVHTPSEKPVVLAFNYTKEQYEVCFWDGTNFLCMADNMPFDPDVWTYLPDTPKREKK